MENTTKDKVTQYTRTDWLMSTVPTIFIRSLTWEAIVKYQFDELERYDIYGDLDLGTDGVFLVEPSTEHDDEQKQIDAFNAILAYADELRYCSSTKEALQTHGSEFTKQIVHALRRRNVLPNINIVIYN